MNETKEKLLQVGASLVREKGFNNAGLKEILKKAEVPKGSFYFYFENKEQFGLELIDVYTSFFEAEMDKIMINKKVSGLKRISKFIDFTKTMFEQENFTGGCPLGNLSLEMGDVNEKFRLKISKGFETMQYKLKNCLDDAKKDGEINKNTNTKSAANFILNSWEGAVLRMKAEKSTQPLDLLKKYIINDLLKNQKK